MLKIRLQRVGRKNDPSFRVVLTDSQNSTKSGRFHSVLGSYDPRRSKAVFDGESIKGWMAKGAKLSDTLHNLLVSHKIIEGKKINVLPKKSPIKKDPPAGGEEAPAAPAAEAAPVAEAEAPASTEEAPAEESKQEEAAPAPTEAPAEPAPAEKTSKEETPAA